MLAARSAARVSREVDALADEMREYAGGIRGRLRLSAWYHVEPDLVDFIRDNLDGLTDPKERTPLRVAVVEDDLSQAELLSHWLELAGHHCHHYDRGEGLMRALLDTGGLGEPPLPGYAVTPALRGNAGARASRAC